MSELEKTKKEQEDLEAQRRYGEYFTNRTVADIMEEYSEQHDEWVSFEEERNQNK